MNTAQPESINQVSEQAAPVDAVVHRLRQWLAVEQAKNVTEIGRIVSFSMRGDELWMRVMGHMSDGRRMSSWCKIDTSQPLLEQLHNVLLCWNQDSQVEQ